MNATTSPSEPRAFGLVESWIVDPETKTVTVLVRDGDVRVDQVFRDDKRAVGLVLPGFIVRVSDLWVETDDDQPDGHMEDGVTSHP